MNDNIKLAEKVYDVGIHDITEDVYHADCCVEPSLSRSIAHTFLEECPMKAYLKHPRLAKNVHSVEPTDAMDFGSLGHALLLGKGAKIHICPFDNWKKDAAQAMRDAARAEGMIPALTKTYDLAVQMQEGVRREFKRLGILTDFDAAKSEQTLIWKDGPIYCRAMIDKLMVDQEMLLATIFDLKITADASPETCIKQIGSMGYSLQHEFYTKGVESCVKDVTGRVKFVFLFVEKTFPFLVTPVELSGEFRAIGLSKYHRAVRGWTECLATGRWPGYSSGVVTASPKPWDLSREMEAGGMAMPTT